MAKNRSDGDGSIYQRHDRGCPPLVDGPADPETGKATKVRPKHSCTKPWVGAVVIGWDTTGEKPKPIRKKVSAPTKSAAAAKVRELRERHALDELPMGKPITVTEWMTHWLTRIAPSEAVDGGRRIRSVKESTVETYTTITEQYVVPLLGNRRLDRLQPEHIENAWDTLLDIGNPLKPEPADPDNPKRHERQPLSPNTVHLAHSVLRRALKVAVQRKRLRVNPAGTDSMDAPPKSDKHIDPIPFEDVTKILAVAATKPGGARWSVALSLGLRPGEARGLRWEDIDFDAGTLTVAQQLQRRRGRGLVADTPKSKSGARVIALPSTLAAQLKAHRKAQNEQRLHAGDMWADHDLVFTLDDGRPIDSSVDHDRWYALLDEAGVTRQRLYDARHSAATMLLIQGVPPRVAQELLGHSSLNVTMGYQHAVDDLKRDAAAKIEAGLWGTA